MKVCSSISNLGTHVPILFILSRAPRTFGSTNLSNFVLSPRHKTIIEHQIWYFTFFCSKWAYVSNFYPREVLSRGSETQLRLVKIKSCNVFNNHKVYETSVQVNRRNNLPLLMILKDILKVDHLAWINLFISFDSCDWIFTHLKLCLADAIHNFKLVKIYWNFGMLPYFSKMFVWATNIKWTENCLKIQISQWMACQVQVEIVICLCGAWHCYMSTQHCYGMKWDHVDTLHTSLYTVGHI